MKVPAPVLRTERLWLDSPVLLDRFAVAEYCRDPLLETLRTLPWPYELRHADFFLYRAVIGAIGRRRELGDVGF